MSNQKNAIDAILAQYEKNNKPSYEPKKESTYSPKNYFNAMLPDGVRTATKTIRILPSQNGGSPFVEMYVHKIKANGKYETFTCPKRERNLPCPFCEAREELLATGQESDKELAKDYREKLTYVIKVIDRDNEADGVKFWRFNHDYRKEGVYDKIIGLINAVRKDITNPNDGHDLVITINRNANNVPIVSSINPVITPSPLSEDKALLDKWLADTRTWSDVYSVKSYEYLEIIVKGGTPVWDKTKKCYVDKASKDESEQDDTDNETTLGIENVKSNLIASKTVDPFESDDDNDDDDDDDDLPF